ncbi:NADH dehydrogenase [ubiquinone] 1 alpha subcomplex subunit 7-like [Oratosquilla oratoria]|uniref:NADH dehydrogenase [ubiquinone] 1 alpha subcomplex subunit 7-like n=1 Tax=Oratosquilla oratoria TaxID=337810 RepID=UPI003F758903
MSKARDVAPILQRIRSFLLGREHTTAHRMEGFYAARTQPDPNLPPGVSHKLSANYYYSRDGRRKVHPAEVLAENEGGEVKLLAAAEEEGAVAVTTRLPKTPGPNYQYDSGM